MTAVLLAVAHESGKRHVVAVRPLYGGTDHLLASGLLGVEATYCAPDEVAAAIRPDTALVMLETPANPTLELVDIRAVVAAAGDVPVLVDNTFATPVLQRPLDLGAAISLHSATKYLGGHGDVVGGVIACDAKIAAALRRTRAITGAILHPLAAYLLHRGLATLPVRVRTQQRHAHVVAEWLATRPEVRAVHFPGFPQCDPRGLIGTQQAGPGAMIAIELAGGFEAASELTANVRSVHARGVARAASTRSSSIPPPSRTARCSPRRSRPTRWCACRSASRTRPTSSPISACSALQPRRSVERTRSGSVYGRAACVRRCGRRDGPRARPSRRATAGRTRRASTRPRAAPCRRRCRRRPDRG